MGWTVIASRIVLQLIGTVGSMAALLWGAWTYKRSAEAHYTVTRLQHYLDLAVSIPIPICGLGAFVCDDFCPDFVGRLRTRVGISSTRNRTTRKDAIMNEATSNLGRSRR